MLQRRETDSGALQLQSCHCVRTERTAVTAKWTRSSESTIRKRKILPHAIDTQILEFTVLHNMWELKGWLNKGQPNLRDKSALWRNKSGRDVIHMLRQHDRQLVRFTLVSDVELQRLTAQRPV